jgi:hypothetical protein
MEIYNWMVQMARSQNFGQYRTILDKGPTSGEGIFSDLELEILNSKRKANYAIVFEDAFPVDLGDIEFDTTMEDVNFVTALVTFKYKLYTVEKI